MGPMPTTLTQRRAVNEQGHLLCSCSAALPTLPSCRFFLPALDCALYPNPHSAPQEKDDDGNSVRPQQFRSLVGKGHPEFSSSRQQVGGSLSVSS